jgi:hypothetical protein
MNPAYEPLIRRVTSVGCDMTTDETTQMLDDLVHALAEQQRSAQPTEPPGFKLRQEYIDAWRDGATSVADLIDPKTP